MMRTLFRIVGGPARLAGLIVLLASGLLCGCAAIAPGDGGGLRRLTSYGPVIGLDDAAANGTWSWKGVPYAQPPVGALRWRAPQDPQPWTAARRATAFAPACVQTQRLYGPGLNNRYDETVGTALGRTVGSEDCLYLNIWTPASRATAPRPVIVFVQAAATSPATRLTRCTTARNSPATRTPS